MKKVAKFLTVAGFFFLLYNANGSTTISPVFANEAVCDRVATITLQNAPAGTTASACFNTKQHDIFD